MVAITHKKDMTMHPKDNESNMNNKNMGTKGQNRQASQNQGNRGKQLNPNQKQPPKK